MYLHKNIYGLFTVYSEACDSIRMKCFYHYHSHVISNTEGILFLC